MRTSESYVVARSPVDCSCLSRQGAKLAKDYVELCELDSRDASEPNRTAWVVGRSELFHHEDREEHEGF